ncbi:MAG TPA: hypothetical protein VNY73_03405, partial [Bacteroidia bacterium]|nr:hypothetical protein [Bacteroidia bacterium]
MRHYQAPKYELPYVVIIAYFCSDLFERQLLKMSKVKYKFNTKSLTYEKLNTTVKERLLKLLSY